MHSWWKNYVLYAERLPSCWKKKDIRESWHRAKLDWIIVDVYNIVRVCSRKTFVRSSTKLSLRCNENGDNYNTRRMAERHALIYCPFTLFSRVWFEFLRKIPIRWRITRIDMCVWLFYVYFSTDRKRNLIELSLPRCEKNELFTPITISLPRKKSL